MTNAATLSPAPTQPTAVLEHWIKRTWNKPMKRCSPRLKNAMIARAKKSFQASCVQWAIAGQSARHVLYQHHGYTVIACKVPQSDKNCTYELHHSGTRVASIGIGTKNDEGWWKFLWEEAFRMGPSPDVPNNWCVELINRGACPPKWWKNCVRRLAWAVLDPSP